MRRVFIRCLIALILFIGIERACRSQTEGFRISKTLAGRHVNTIHSLPAEIGSQQQILSLLNQEFKLIGSGVQSYVFLGEDNLTILKLFKQHHAGLSTPFLERLSHVELAHFFALPILEKRNLRMASIFESVAIAFNELREETGLLFAHLYSSDQMLPKIQVVDKIGIAHALELDRASFLLQKRGMVLEKVLESALIKGDHALLFSHLRLLIEKKLERLLKGIANSDARALRNAGFIRNCPLEIDVGSFYHDPSLREPGQLYRRFLIEMAEVENWIRDHAPEHLQQFHEQLFSSFVNACDAL